MGWDTLDEPTYRHEAFDAYQSGREFDEELLDQLDLLPKFVSACGFATAKAPGYDFLQRLPPQRSSAAGPPSLQAVTATRFNSYRNPRDSASSGSRW